MCTFGLVWSAYTDPNLYLYPYLLWGTHIDNLYVYHMLEHESVWFVYHSPAHVSIMLFHSLHVVPFTVCVYFCYVCLACGMVVLMC